MISSSLVSRCSMRWTVTTLFSIIIFGVVTTRQLQIAAAFDSQTVATRNPFHSTSCFIMNPSQSLIRQNTLLLMAAPRQPRRMLKKRRSRRDRDSQQTDDDDFPWDTAESRPLVSSRSKEAGEDYWISEDDLAAQKARQQAIANRKAMEGEVPKEKLWTEVKAPYRQNWIGYFSMMIVILSAIIIKFPELLEQPIIQIPDL